MNMNKSGTISANQRAKLLAAIAALVMVVCAVAIIAPSSEGVTTPVAAPADGGDLQQAIDNASAGDTLVLAAGAEYTPESGYYTIDKNLTIRSESANNKATITGSFLVNTDRATFENIKITSTGSNEQVPARNAITFVGNNLTVTGCEMTLGTQAGDILANGISFFPQSTSAVLNVSSSTFTGYGDTAVGYSSSAIVYGVDAPIAAGYIIDAEKVTTPSANMTMTADQALAVYNNNDFSGCLNTVSFHDWAASGGEQSGYYVVNESYNGYTDMTTIIPEDATITLAEGDMDTTGETVINYGTIIVPDSATAENTNIGKNSITNYGTVQVNNGVFNGTIEGGDVIVYYTGNTVNYPTMGSGTDLTVLNVQNYDDYTPVEGAEPLNYTTVYVQLTNGAYAIIGIDSVYYDSTKNYAGTGSTGLGGGISVKILSSTTGSGDTLSFTGMNEVYDNRDNASADNGEYGEATNAGTYYIRMNLVTFIDGAYATIPVIGDFKILPQQAESVEIEWTTADGDAPQKAYNGEAGVTLNSDEYRVVATINGEKVVLTPDQYTVKYTNNVRPTTEGATITVTLTGNYAGTADGTFYIVDKYVDLEIENTKDTYYIGETIDTTKLTVTGITDAQDEKVLDYDATGAAGYTIEPVTLTTSGPVIVTVNYTVGGQTLSKTFQITVIGVSSIKVTSPPTTVTYTPTVENPFTGINTTGLQVQVTYEDDTTATFADSDGTGLKKTGSDVVDQNFTITNMGGAGRVPIEVGYFGATDTFYVTIEGFGIIYMIGEEIYGTQVGADSQEKIIYNYFGMQDDAFSGWLVEGTNSVYAPGSSIVLGEDQNMWGDAENPNITLIAQFGGSTGGNTNPEAPSENILISVVSTETGVDVYLVGLDGGYIPTGTITVTYYYTYYIDYGGVQIPASGSMPITFEITEPSEGFVLVQSFSFVGVEHASDITNVDATFGDLSSEMIVYTPAQTATA